MLTIPALGRQRQTNRSQGLTALISEFQTCGNLRKQTNKQTNGLKILRRGTWGYPLDSISTLALPEDTSHCTRLGSGLLTDNEMMAHRDCKIARGFDSKAKKRSRSGVLSRVTRAGLLRAPTWLRASFHGFRGRSLATGACFQVLNFDPQIWTLQTFPHDQCPFPRCTWF